MCVDPMLPLPLIDISTRGNGNNLLVNASFPLSLASAAHCVYTVQRLHQRQVEAISRLVLDESSHGCLMLVNHISAVKFLVLFLTDTAVGKGVTLVFVSLLSLTANPIAKPYAVVQRFRTIHNVHPDELTQAELIGTVMNGWHEVRQCQVAGSSVLNPVS